MPNAFRCLVTLFLVAALLTALTPVTSSGGMAGAGRDPTVARAEFAHSGDGLLFIENVGQFPDGARFLIRGGPQTMWLADDALWITLTDRQPLTADRKQKSGPRREAGDTVQDLPSAICNLRLSFPNSNPRARLEPFNRLDTHLSYLKGNDPARWRKNVPVWGGVRYVDLYPGVDLEITGEGGAWNWRLASSESQGAGRISKVQLQVKGAEALVLDGNQLNVATAAGDLHLPLLTLADLRFADLQLDELQPVNVERVSAQTFDVRAPFAVRHSQSTISDPKSVVQDYSNLVYATYLGGYFYDRAHALAVDSTGNAYVSGATQSPDFPTTPGAAGEFFNGGDYDAFVAKMNSSGSALLYATFLGGIGDDWGNDYGRGIAVNGSGNAYVTGWTNSRQFPVTPGAYDTTFNGREDTFMVKLNATGTELVYATFLGGSKTDRGVGIGVDNAGNAYVTGWTDSTDFPVVAADANYNTYRGGAADAFVVKLNSAGSALDYALFVGGSDQDIGLSLAVNPQGYAYLTGLTESSDFPWRLATDYTLSGTVDAFVSYVRPSGGNLFYSTYLGGSNDEIGGAIAADAMGNAYIMGETNSTDLTVTPGAFDTSYNGGAKDAFVTKMNSTGRIVYATFLGDSTDDTACAIAADSAGNAYAAGILGDKKVMALSAVGSSATPVLPDISFGANDLGTGVAVEPGGDVIVVVYTSYSALPVTPNAFDTSSNNIWLARTGEVPYVAGRVTEYSGQPLVGIEINADSVYSTTTDANGYYTLTLPAGVYTLNLASGYFWTPDSRVLTVPPSATDQDWVASHIRKQVTPGSTVPTPDESVLSYTVGLVYPADGDYTFYDRIPTYTTYFSGSSSGPAGVIYDAAANAISGTLSLTGNLALTVTFRVQVMTGTEELAPRIVNRACVRAAGSDLAACEWSNETVNYTHLWSLYLPLVMR